MENKIPRQWSSAWRSLTEYWAVYGGYSAFVGSPYFVCSLVVAVLCRPYWKFPGDGKEAKWIQNVIDVVPGLLGFSIGAFAVILVFSSDKFLSVISEDGKAKSLFLRVCSLFVHFIIVQALCLILTLLTNVYYIFAGISFFLMVYAITCSIAAALALFNLAQVYNTLSPALKQPEHQQTKGRDRPSAEL